MLENKMSLDCFLVFDSVLKDEIWKNRMSEYFFKNIINHGMFDWWETKNNSNQVWKTNGN